MTKEKKLNNFNIFLLILISLITLGVYIPIWFLLKFKILNKLNTNEKIGIFFILLTVTILFLFIFDIVIAVISQFDKSYYNEAIDNIITLISFFSILLLAFKVRYNLLKYIYKNDINMDISKWLTLLFTIYYLQYKFNRISLIENEEKK